MSPDVWEKINKLFHEALAVDIERRGEFLRVNCDSAEVFGEVSALLAAHEGENNFLHETAFDAGLQVIGALETEECRGKRIGAYQITGELGRGGMGAVFSAARADGLFEQRVAIKLLPRSILSDTLIERFRRERQILANLNHPFIARLFDGGETNEKIPYIVMELVRGETIIEFCRNRNLSVSERLELFLKICEAVRYAHAQGVVHRDLKPSNILINENGAPKLLDFGIAKFLQSDAAEETTGGFNFLTPEYASPEQVSGLPVTEQADVYSLGILLYELLTDTRPYRFENRSPMGIARVICEAEPERPSTFALRRATVSANPTTRTENTARNNGQRANLVSKDLDFIVLKALRKQTVRRYASVAEFAFDIERFQKGLPVNAAPDSFFYRARKFTKRNRSLAIAACCTALLAIFTIGFSFVQNLRHNSAAKTFARKSLPADNAFRLTNNAGEDLQPHWSADCKQIYFTSSRSPQRATYRMNVDGSNQILAGKDFDEFNIQPSPDGKLTAFISNRDGNGEIYVAKAEFSAARKITDCRVGRYSWSGDGRKIAYGCRQNGFFDIYTIEPNGANNRRIAHASNFEGDVNFSPDGKRIALASSRDGQLEIYVMDADGANAMRLTDNAADDRLPVFSPDGRRIAFTSSRNGNDDIFLMNADGSNPVSLTTAAGNDDEPSFSPDGSRIAFQSERDGNAEIYLINLAGEAIPNLEDRFTDEIEGSLAPDGKRIVFASNRTGQFQIYTADADGSNLRQLTGEGANRYPSFSPDGSRIIFDRTDTGSPPAIYRMDADGTNQAAIFADEKLRGFQKLSPDASRIAFVKATESGDNIFIINIDGSDERQLTFDSLGNQFPSWTADGKRIIFSSWNDGKLGIRSIDADGSDLFALLNGNAVQPDVSNDGRIAFQSKQSGDWEIWLMNADGTNPRQLTFSGAGILNQKPHFSPDAKAIIYDSNEHDQDHLRVLRLP